MTTAENTLIINSKLNIFLILFFFSFFSFHAISQSANLDWTTDGNSYYRMENNEIVQYELPNKTKKVIVSKDQLLPQGSPIPLKISSYKFSGDKQKVLLFTNTKRVWRINSRGNYWVLDMTSGTLFQLGKSLPDSSLMFAKFSPDGNSVAYVSNNNIYVEDLTTLTSKALTNDGTNTLINGTFDWAYEEEFSCRDGFRWSPDSKSIAYWQIDASKIKKFNLVNYTDSIYSRIIPIEYPKAGETPSSAKVGVINIADSKTTWMSIPGDASQHYIVRMEYIPGSNNLLLQQLNRKQNQSKLFISESNTGNSKIIQEETDKAWVDIYKAGDKYALDFTNKFIWLNNGRSMLWASEKDGWRHLYEVSLEGKPERLITHGNYDFIDLKHVDIHKGFVYFMASPDNATQKYLYRTKLNGKGKAELLSPEDLKGTHDYFISPNGAYAVHEFSNHFTKKSSEIISLANHKPINQNESISANLHKLEEKPETEFFKITTADNVEMDGWMVKPKDFDPSKKYPVLFYVYGEPATATVADSYGESKNPNYKGDMAEDGYIYISLDNRGTPAPKGREWRKSIYKKFGQNNVRDQALAAKEILKWSFVDPERIAVWGHSGGGASTLNLLFQYPEIYQTGIALAAVTDLLTYDNIYQERYMGLPQENMEDYIHGSPITHAKNLTGNLLYIHGTGDDNVHYQNAELLVNELVKNLKQFQFMAYPNRTHGIREGEGTTEHLKTLYTNFLKMHCPPGGR